MGRDGAIATLFVFVSLALLSSCGGNGKPARKPRIVSSTPVPGTATTTATVASTKDGAIITLRTRQTCEIVRETPFVSGGWIRRKDRKPCKSRPLANAPMLFRVGNKLEIELGNTSATGTVTIRWAELRPRLGKLTARFGKVVVSRTSQEVATLGIASSSQSASEREWRRAIKLNTVQGWVSYMVEWPKIKRAQATAKLLAALIAASDAAIRGGSNGDVRRVRRLSSLWAKRFARHRQSARYQSQLGALLVNAQRPALTRLTNNAIAHATRLAPGFARGLLGATTRIADAMKKRAPWAKALASKLADARAVALRRAAAKGRKLRRKRKLNAAFSLLSAASFLDPRNRRVRRELRKVTSRLRGVRQGFTQLEAARRGGRLHLRVTAAIHISRRVRARSASLSLVCEGGKRFSKKFAVRAGSQTLRWRPTPKGIASPGPLGCKLTGSVVGRGAKPHQAVRYCWKRSDLLSSGECR